MNKKNINNNIQALRAVAIILVIVQHIHRLPIPSWLLETYSKYSYWTGVDIFLAISGYLMCRSLSGEFEHSLSKKSAFISFFKKRIFRLAPALLFWLFAGIIISYFMQPSFGVSIEKSLNTFLYSTLAISNIYYFNETIQGASYDPLLSVTWSLSLEWQLYLILAVLFFCTKIKYLKISLLVIFIISSLLLPNGENHQLTLGWWLRPQAFVLGALVYFYESEIKSIKVGKTNALIFFIFSLFLLVIYTTKVDHSYKLAFIGVAGAIAFVSLGLISYEINIGLLNWIGDRSYSIYLCHIPSMLITKSVMDKLLNNTIFFHNSIIYITVFIAMTLFLATLSYLFIEKFFISMHKRKVDKQSNSA